MNTNEGDGGRLQGRIALVSGGGSIGDTLSNGRAQAILLARAGACVVVADVNLDSAEETRAMIEREGCTAIAVRCDVTNPEECRLAAQTAIETYGGVDILVNNVGIGGPMGTAEDVDVEAWEHCYRVNVTSMVLMSRQVIPSMRERGGGAIVNISSIDGLAGGSDFLAYPTTKGAVVNMTRAMAGTHGPDGIRVNCVAPGRIWSALVSGSPLMNPENRERRRLVSALQTEGTPWDIGHATVFLVSDEAQWISGVVLPVDGGETAIRRRPEIFPAMDTAATSS